MVFPFDLFLDTYDSTNDVKAINLDSEIKCKINNLYNENYLNYKKFVDEIICLLKLSPENKNEYLKKEEVCYLCTNNYPHSYKIFYEFIDCYTSKNIKVCFDCAYTKYKCSNCDYDFGYGQYEKIYVYTNKDFNDKKLFFGNKCYLNIDNIPIVSLFFKNTNIVIEFKNIKL